MLNINELIDNAVENYLSEEDKELLQSWDEFYNTLDETRKSNIVRILIGNGVLVKGDNGKLQKGPNYRKHRSILKKSGIDHTKVTNPNKKTKK